MPVRKSTSIPAEIVPNATGVSKQVLIGDQEGPNFAMRLFTVEAGGSMPLHSNLVEHEQYVVSGKAKLHLGNETKEVREGDVVFIPGGVAHSYTNSGEQAFKFICVIPNKPDQMTIIDK